MKNISIKMSDELKKSLKHRAEQTNLGVSTLGRIFIFMGLERMKEMDDDLKEMGKSLSELSVIIDKRYLNYALGSLKALIQRLPPEDRMEVLMAIEKNRKKHCHKNKQEMERLEKFIV